MLPFRGHFLQDIGPMNLQNHWPNYLAFSVNTPWIHPFVIHSEFNMAHPPWLGQRNPHILEYGTRNHDVAQVQTPQVVVRSQTADEGPDDKSGCQFKNCTHEESSSFKARRRKVVKRNKVRLSIPQNKSRNILPSMIHKVISYISKKNKSQDICVKVLAYLTESPVDSNLSRYYSFLRQIKSRQNHYVNEKALSALCDVQETLFDLYPRAEQQFYLKVARIMARHFLGTICPRLMFSSKRISKQKRIEHLGTRRDLLSLLSDLRLWTSQERSP